VVLVLVGEAGVETIVMAGRKGTGAGWTIGDIGAAAGAGADDCTAVGDGTSARGRVGEQGRSNEHSDSGSDSGWESVLRPRHLELRLQVPHRSLSPRRLRIRGHAGVSGWCLRLLSDKVRIEPGGELVSE
jgi:hypothetical protein